MAYASTTRNGVSSIFSRLTAGMSVVKSAFAQRRIYSRTARELSGLTDRELADLGIHRSMITEIAREAAYGK